MPIKKCLPRMTTDISDEIGGASYVPQKNKKCKKRALPVGKAQNQLTCGALAQKICKALNLLHSLEYVLRLKLKLEAGSSCRSCISDWSGASDQMNVKTF